MVNEDDVKEIKNIIIEILEIVNETNHEVKENDDISKAWKLLGKGSKIEELQEIVERLLQKTFDNDTWEGRLKSAESRLIKGHLLALCPDFQAQTSDTPMDCVSDFFRLTGQVIKQCDRLNHDFDKIGFMFKCFNIVLKVRNFYLRNLISIGLPKEMRMLAKMCVDIGVQMSLLPSLCHELLESAEVDLICDDAKQAEVKLREVESMLKERLRAEPQKIKTKSRYGFTFLTQNKPFTCYYNPQIFIFWSILTGYYFTLSIFAL